MRTFISAFIIAIVMLCAGEVTAQRYVADPFMQDSVTVENIGSVKGKVIITDEAFKLAKGDTVNVLREVEGFPEYGVIKVDGKEYAVFVHDFEIVDEEGVEDRWNTKNARWRTPDGRYFTTMTPYYWIIGIVAGALLLMLLGVEIKLFRILGLIFVPVMIALACWLEVRAYATLQTDMFWWCDNEVYGFWGSSFRVFLFTLVLAVQLASFPLYGRLISKEGTPMAELVPMGISFLVALPITAVVVLICALFHVSHSTQDIIGTCIVLGTVGIGSISTIALNVKSYGFFKGIWLTVFGAIYIVGAMISVLGFAIALWHLFVQILVTLAPWLAIGLFLMMIWHAGGDPVEQEQQQKNSNTKQDSTLDIFMGTDTRTKRIKENEERRRHGLHDRWSHKDIWGD